jgi:hypothetical protein
MERMNATSTPLRINYPAFKVHAMERRHALTLLIIPPLVIHVHLFKKAIYGAILAVIENTLITSKAKQVERTSQ